MTDTPLAAVPGWSSKHIDRLQAAWITTAEQVVALGATADGIQSLSEQLQVSPDETRRLVELAARALSEDVRAEMEAPVDTSNYGLGARRPGKENHKP
jgi:hypothetical protein